MKTTTSTTRKRRRDLCDASLAATRPTNVNQILLTPSIIRLHWPTLQNNDGTSVAKAGTNLAFTPHF